jgi:hypothetical protein
MNFLKDRGRLRRHSRPDERHFNLPAAEQLRFPFFLWVFSRSGC